MTDPQLLRLPKNPGHLIFEAEAQLAVKLKRRREFAKYCTARDLRVDEARLERLERLGVFRPIARMVDHPDLPGLLNVPGGPVKDWIKKGALIDTYRLDANYDVPAKSDENSEAYYSIFQIDHLEMVLNDMTGQVLLDADLLEEEGQIDWVGRGEFWVEHAKKRIDWWKKQEFRQALPILCQYVANLYYFRTQGNGRMIAVSKGNSGHDQWMNFNTGNWDWRAYRRAYDLNEIVDTFDLTQAKSKHAYLTLARAAKFCDPLEKWGNLVDFISLPKKKYLKGAALKALGLRDAANMLRLLHQDLYDEVLVPVHQATGTVLKEFPEKEIREDTRRHLEFVVNQYDLNPQPKLVLFVEGRSETVMVNEIFKSYYGHHPGRIGIEIVDLRGVNNATGNKKEDRFRAILRLVDYLHDHQSLTFLILDRENYAERLKQEARKARSLHGQNRFAMPEDHIALWDVSLEFDNFSDTEIASALSALNESGVKFKRSDVKIAREAEEPGKALRELYARKTQERLKKPKLAALLSKILIDPKAKRRIYNRPLVKLLDQVCLRAMRNPFPTRQDIWANNQEFGWLGGPKKPKS